jgi:hypothetical protein
MKHSSGIPDGSGSYSTGHWQAPDNDNRKALNKRPRMYEPVN